MPYLYDLFFIFILIFIAFNHIRGDTHMKSTLRGVEGRGGGGKAKI